VPGSPTTTATTTLTLQDYDAGKLKVWEQTAVPPIAMECEWLPSCCLFGPAAFYTTTLGLQLRQAAGVPAQAPAAGCSR
jgi:hypothetical protein